MKREKLLVVVANEMKRIAGVLNACMKMKLTILFISSEQECNSAKTIKIFRNELQKHMALLI